MELNEKEKNHEMSFVNSISSPVLNEQFNRLCKGEILLSPSHSKDIKCFSLHHFDPYLRLGPFKLDDQSISPYVTVIRDFLAGSEMEYYKEFARPRLFRSEFGGNKQGVTRTSKQTWLHDYYEDRYRMYISRMGVGPYYRKEDLVEQDRPATTKTQDQGPPRRH